MQPWAVRQYEAAKGRSIGICSGALGFGFNTELLAKKNLAAPAWWVDLLKPGYKGEVQVANPNASGTAYVVIATLIQILGEDKAFAYLKGLRANINA